MLIAFESIREKARSLISVAALFVKVNVRIEEGSIPIEIRYANRVVMVLVFPEPAPASINKEPSICCAAFC